MSQRQHASIFHFHIVLIIAVLIAASLDVRAHAQQDQNANGGNAERPPDSTGQAAKEPSSAPAKENTPQSSGEGIPATVLDRDQVQGILGKQVRSSAGEDMGRIVDVIVDRSARVLAVVIDFGGFLGVGNRQIAVAWNAIRFSSQGKPDFLVVDFTRDQLRVVPTYKAGEQIVLLGASGNPNSPSSGGPSDKDPPSNDTPTK
jgi:PRC-barrel domain